GHRSWVRGLAFLPAQGKLLSADYTGKMFVWPSDAKKPEPERVLDAHRGWCRAVAVTPDGTRFATCGNDHLVKIWSALDFSLIRPREAPVCPVYNVAFHPEGLHVVPADLHGNIRHWNLETGELVRTMDCSVLFRYDTTFRADHGGIR